MEINQLTAAQRTVIHQNNDLRRYLDSLDKRQATTRRSWLYENEDVSSVLQRWINQLKILEHGSKEETEVFSFDMAQLEKFGPQGGHPPISSVLKTAILPSFMSTATPTVNSNQWSNAVAKVVSTISEAGVYALRPISWDRAVRSMSLRGSLISNSGWPLFARRKTPHIIEQTLGECREASWLKFPAIALFRYYNAKLRLVWMFPFSTNVVESAFTIPLLESMKQSSLPWFAPWIGFDQVRRDITDAYDSGDYLYASDFSATDEHFNIHVAKLALEFVTQLFQHSFSSQIVASVEHMQSIPLVTGVNQVVLGEHGLSSGSAWTNLLETCFDLCFAELTKFSEPQLRLQYAIGDDMLWRSKRFLPKAVNVISACGEQVNMIVKLDKATAYRNKVKTLQRLFQRGYRRPDGLLRGVYPTIRALKSSIYPEKFHNPKIWSSDMFCVRQFMILENCVDHPLFEEFVKFVCGGQKDLIPFAHQTAEQINKAYSKSKLIAGLNPTYNQEQEGVALSDFASIEIAKRLG